MINSSVKRAIIVLAVMMLIFIGSTLSQAKEYEIANYDINMQLTEVGDYVITERITYNFKEGTFTKGYREIKGKGFKNLEFISIRGVEQQVNDYQLQEGRDLVINWQYPPAVGQITFIIKYIARSGLLSREGRNIIDWNPVGSDWQVPIRRVNVELGLPQRVENLEIAPRQDLITANNNRVITFSHHNLPPRTYYHLVVSFDQIIGMPNPEPEGGLVLAVVLALAAGLIYLFTVIIRGIRFKPEKLPVEISPTEMSFVELGVLFYHANSQSKKKGISAQLFELARQGKVRLVSKLKKGPFKSRSTEVEVKVISQEGLSSQEKILVSKLEKHDTLKKLMYDYKGLAEITDSGDRVLVEKDLVSEEKTARKRSVYFSALYALLAGVVSLLIGAFALDSQFLGLDSLLIGIGIFLVLVFIGRLIKGAFIPVLTGEGFYLKEKVKKLLDEKKDGLDKLISSNPSTALEFFFRELSYIILHPKFTAAVLNKYKKEFKKAEEFQIPEWIELDAGDLGKTLDALDLVEVIDYVLLSTIFVAGTTGTAGVGGAGAPGSGAGGGGGGAS